MDLPLGARVDPGKAHWPENLHLDGRWVQILPLDAGTHGAAIWEAVRGPQNAGLWTYLFDGPFEHERDFLDSLSKKASRRDAVYYAIVNKRSGLAAGYASYMRIEPAHRCMEIGDILYSPALQNTAAATEAMYLMARFAFEEGNYRRYEWKCNALNEPSRRAALRLGFRFEGIFRHHMIVKGLNRDTAWFSMIDSEWPACKRAFEAWLATSNFDSEGKQIRRLADLRAEVD